MEQKIDWNVAVCETLKTNVKETQLRIQREETDRMCPSVSIEGAFKEYTEGKSLDDIVDIICETVAKAFEANAPFADGEIDWDNFEEKVFFCIVNTEKNEELLKTIPHRRFGNTNLSIVYKWNVGNDSEGMYTNTITNAFMESREKTEEELYELAYANTKRLFPTTIRSMEDVIREMMGGMIEGMDEVEELMESQQERRMYVISNKAAIFGASSIIYSDDLMELAEKIGTDLYILPSSIHECIAISEKYGTPEDLKEMVTEINENEVDDKDVLSDNVYIFRRETGTIELAA